MNIPNKYEIIVLLLGINGGRFEGKTNIHKNIYLLKEMLSNRIPIPFRFKPYFYGPFSEEISNTLDILETGLFIDTNEFSFGNKDDFEYKKIIYALTENGNREYERIKKNYVEFYNKLNNKFTIIKGTNFHQNTRILSTAAKVKLILAQENKPLTNENIKNKALILGWEISDKDIESAIDLLETTKLAKRVTKE